jgi:capsular polysaccharide biosynthesis protein
MRLNTPARLQLSRADLEPLLRLALIPLVAAFLGLVCGLVYSLAQSTLYESRSQVVVSPASGFLDPSQSDSFAAISTAVQELALTQRVLSEAVGRLDKAGVEGHTTDWLRGRLRLSISGDTPILTIKGVDGSQTVASAISKAETNSLVNTINNVSSAEGIRLQVFSEGEARGKVQPETWRNVLLGSSAGLIIGCFVLAQLLSRGYHRRSA